MAGDEVATMDAHCADLVVADPDAGVRRSDCRQPKIKAQAIDHSLEKFIIVLTLMFVTTNDNGKNN